MSAAAIPYHLGSRSGPREPIVWLDPNPRVTNHEITEDTKSSVRAEAPDVRGRSGRAATGRASTRL